MYSTTIEHESFEQGQRLKELRKLTLLSRRAFAKKYNFNASSYQAWEDGKYKKGLSLQHAVSLIDAFNQENIVCTIDWLLRGHGDAPKRLFYKSSLQNKGAVQDIADQANAQKNMLKLNQQLVEAIRSNKIEHCKDLIAQGANLHTLNNMQLYLYSYRQQSALHFAAGHAGASLIQMFVDLGLGVNQRNRVNDTPLHIASWEGNLKTIQKLHELGASIDATNNEGTTPVMWASSNNKPSALALLVKLGGHLNYTDFFGNTAAHWSALRGHLMILKDLYNLGAYLDIKNHFNQTPLDIAIDNGQVRVANELVQLLGIK